MSTRESDSATINVDVCSELTEVATPASVVKGNHKLVIVSGASGHPIIVSIGTDNVGFSTPMVSLNVQS